MCNHWGQWSMKKKERVVLQYERQETYKQEKGRVMEKPGWQRETWSSISTSPFTATLYLYTRYSFFSQQSQSPDQFNLSPFHPPIYLLSTNITVPFTHSVPGCLCDFTSLLPSLEKLPAGLWFRCRTVAVCSEWICILVHSPVSITHSEHRL